MADTIQVTNYLRDRFGQIHLLGGFLDTFISIYPQVQDGPTTRRGLTMNRSRLNGGSYGSSEGDVVPWSPFRAAHTLNVAERFVCFTAKEQS